MFSKYHYLNANIHKSSQCYVGKINEKAVVFCAVLHHPVNTKRKRKSLWRVSRLVVLPDYQGVGIGNRFLETIGRKYLNENKRFCITTTTPALLYYFKKSPLWKCVSLGFNPQGGGKFHFGGHRRITTSWQMEDKNQKSLVFQKREKDESV